jgi:ATP-dependent Lhr-like helicase
LKGEPYRIVSVEGDKVTVEPSQDIEAAIPGWEGELIPVPFSVAQEVAKMRGNIAELLKKKSEKEVIAEIQKKYPVDDSTAKKMISIIEKQMKYGKIPDDKKILVEEFENTMLMHTCFGTNANDALGRFFAAMLTSRMGSVGLKVDPYRIILEFQSKPNRAILQDLIFSTKPEHLRSYIEMALTKTELFEWKFIHVAKRFGAISRHADYGKFAMKRIIQDFMGSPIWKEALRELETEKLDIAKAEEMLKKIQSKELPLIFSSGLSPIGKYGMKERFAEVVGPEKPEREIFEIFRNRIMETKARMICTNCGQWSQVYKVEEISNDLKCPMCNARTLAMARENDTDAQKIVKKSLRKTATLTTEEQRKVETLKSKADLFLVYKKKAIIVMAGRGIGPTIGKRILAKFHKSDTDLLKDMIQAERQFMKTKKFWST